MSVTEKDLLAECNRLEEELQHCRDRNRKDWDEHHRMQSQLREIIDRKSIEVANLHKALAISQQEINDLKSQIV